MLRTKNWGKEEKIGGVILWWTLAQAFDWRQKHRAISVQQAFDELRMALSPERAIRGGRWLVWASGIKTGWRPTKGWRSGNLPAHEPFRDPPAHDPKADLIPVDEWPELVLASGSVEEIAAGKLDYARERTPAWRDIHFPRDE